MMLHFKETIRGRAPELVLPVLERCLRDIAWEVVHVNNQLIAYGIGPSPRTINCSDQTILKIDEEGEATLLTINAQYQGTSLLEEEPQNESVRLRLTKVLECLKSELDLAPIEVAIGEPASLSNAVNDYEPSLKTSSEPFDITAQYVAPPSSPSPEDDFDLSPPAPALEESPASYPPAWSSRHIMPQSKWVIAGIMLSLLIVGVASLRSLHRNSGPTVVTNATSSNNPQPDSTSEDLPITSAPSGISSKVPQQPPALTQNNPEITRTIEAWAASERSRNPVAQASFYANKVNPYLDKKSVRHDTVLRAKRASIRHRTGLWTFKIENVTVNRESATAARVWLIKHSMAQSDSPVIDEKFVLSQLWLIRVNGAWKISGEQDFN